MTRILKADVELFLCGYIRAALADGALVAKYPVLANFEVDNREPDVDALDFPDKLVVVRLDADNDTDVALSTASVGISVLVGEVENTLNASMAARIVHAIVRDSAQIGEGNPVAAVTASNGPYAVPEDQPRARYYSTHDLAVVGTAL